MPTETSANQKTILGVVLLNTNFPRVKGDIGNPDSFDFPVLYRRVEGASVARVTSQEPTDDQLRGEIVAAAQALEKEGATMIATSCGFLGGLQEELVKALRVPVVTSSLLALPTLETIYGAGRVGVLTFDARNLQAHHFPAEPTGKIPLAGLEQGKELHRVIAEDCRELDIAAAREDCISAASRLIQDSPEIKALLLECTNISPYRTDLQAATGLSVYDLLSVIDWIARL